MEKLKNILHKLLFPGTAVVVLSIPVGGGLLAYTFLVAGEESPVAYVSYVVSAYALAIVCAGLVPALKKANRWIRRNPLIKRFLENVPFRLRITLHVSLGINLLYAVVNGVSGVYYRSVWFGTLSVYYIFLTVMRFLLARYSRQHGFGGDRKAELHRCRLCGAVLVPMNLALAGVVILVISQNQGFEYAGTLIYAMALYTFYITVMAVINLVRYRKYNSPVMSASRAVNLAAALVSMLSLETAMLTQFDDGTTAPYFRPLMVGITGGVVCALVVGMGAYMITHATRELREMEAN